jgi:hypothetical protein
LVEQWQEGLEIVAIDKGDISDGIESAGSR